MRCDTRRVTRAPVPPDFASHLSWHKYGRTERGWASSTRRAVHARAGADARSAVTPYFYSALTHGSLPPSALAAVQE
eukprot:scaffold43469_cov34-Tisochrysis_lutea.AAC.6